MSEIPETQRAFEQKYNCTMTITRVESGMLLHCPFCAQSNLVVQSLPMALDENQKKDHVLCNTCGASAPTESWQERHSYDKGTL
ncbi:hypothetical protein BM525_19800 (plasmid) [Alteromonas mediterranea]|uniref:Uncharacterized protein n=1 Tax=Alteromonas mediterranea TaxID=314275 RepID=A0AAC9JDS6_9ALTE|nr:hypothetical protein BM524_19605 [Alteromonas mediterranea]APD99983.1 hypothetical protein BM525_19800 [Alteromonas mediterranea]